ncbi:MAG: DnaJ domain-containing protein, partial [Cyclobacteriaceae bacterium]|nr:DnaJ domain-containing protein [Cyclobacteriaceae bacterium]
MLDKDYYDILGVSKNASKEEIEIAFSVLSHQFKKYNVTNQEGNNVLHEIKEAYSILSDSNNRLLYDSYIESKDKYPLPEKTTPALPAKPERRVPITERTLQTLWIHIRAMNFFSYIILFIYFVITYFIVDDYFYYQSDHWIEKRAELNQVMLSDRIRMDE